MRGTPRTDAELQKQAEDGFYSGIADIDATNGVPADFARTLERELAAVTRRRDEILADLMEATERFEDKARLDWLTAQSTGYGNGWIARQSTTGRGFRLHEHGGEGCHPTPREAIDAARNEQP